MKRKQKAMKYYIRIKYELTVIKLIACRHVVVVVTKRRCSADASEVLHLHEA